MKTHEFIAALIAGTIFGVIFGILLCASLPIIPQPEPTFALIYTPTGQNDEYALDTNLTIKDCHQRYLDFEKLPGHLICLKDPGK